MRKVLAALLSATVLMPAVAQAQRDDGDGRFHERRAVSDRDRGEGGFRPAREQVERPAPPPREERAAPPSQADRPAPPPGGGFDRGRRDDFRDARRDPRDPRPDVRREQQAQDARGFQGDWRRDGGGRPDQARPDRGDWRPGTDPRRPDAGPDPRRPDARADRWREADRLRAWNRSDIDWRDQARRDDQFRDRQFGNRQFDGRSAWNRDWRRDGRYDWNGWRSRNRDYYRMPRYYAPPNWGYGYRRFSIGITLNAALWGQNYWIGDPWEYRLPPAYGPYRWVRYYNDALLVDVRYGQVVDVVYDIFW